MEYYEVMFLLDVNLPDDERRDIANEVEKELIDLGAEVDSSEQYDVRELAYPIDNVKRADYRLIEFRAEAESSVLDDLRERLNFRDDITRYLITNQRKDRHPDEVFESPEEEAKEPATSRDDEAEEPAETT
jgi:small subunit ribosomal protein S6